MNLLKIGDKAPNIQSKDEQGNDIKLSQFKGKKVILFFYPKDDTGTCTKEACNYRDNYDLLKKQGFEVVGISTDDEKKHQKFINKYGLNFHLIADVEQKVVNDYGVWGLKKFMGREYMGTNRVTYVIDEKGKIEQVIAKVDAANSAQQVLDLYK